MSFIKALARSVALRGILVLALGMGVMATAPRTAIAQGSDDWVGAPITEADVSPSEHEDEEQGGDSELPWLFAVFFITWAVFFAYVFVMSRRQREMQQEIEALSSALAERERQTLQSGPGPKSPGP
jgi:CcmD family protein